MWIKPTSLGIITASLIAGLTINVSSSSAQSVQFECATDDQNIPTTYAQTPGGIVQIFKWTSTFFNPPYTPIQRCQEVAQRLNQFQPDSLVAGRVNNYNVICAGTSCDAGGTNLLLTLRPDQSPNQVLAEIDSTRDAAGGPSMQLGGGSTNKNQPKSNLFTTADGSTALNLKGYIQSAPVIPRNLSSNSNSASNHPSQPTNNNNTNSSSTLNQQPITVPANTSKPSARGSAW